MTDVSFRVIWIEWIVEAVKGVSFLKISQECVFVKCVHIVSGERKQNESRRWQMWKRVTEEA